MAYLRGVENDLSSFSKFVQKADSILKKLRVSSSKLSSKVCGNTSRSGDDDGAQKTNEVEEVEDSSDERKEKTPVPPSSRY